MYSLLGKAFEKQTKAIKDGGRKIFKPQSNLKSIKYVLKKLWTKWTKSK